MDMGMGSWKTVLLLLAVLLLADFIEGKSGCKNKTKKCKKRKDWCFKAGLQEVMLAECRKTCGLCNAPECKVGQIITQDNECEDLECPSKCKKMISELSKELTNLQQEYDDLTETQSQLDNRVSKLEKDEEDKPTKRYIIVPSKVNWESARAGCLSMSQGSLAEAVTLSHHEMLRKLIASSPHQSHCDHTFWVGAKENGRDSSGRIFIWIKSGQRVTPGHWGPNEPNKDVTKCVEYRRYSAAAGYLLNDQSCGRSSVCYVCEQPV